MKKILVYFLLIFLAPAYAQKGAYALYSYDSATYMVSHNIAEVRSIASITKLFTALTVIKSGVDLEEKIKVAGKSSGHVPAGIYVSRMDLLRATIISSDNRAAETLANNHPGGFNQFIRDVNKYLDDHSLYDTKIVDSTGLLAGNVSTARDLVEFIHQIQNEKIIRSIANEKNTVLNLPKGKKTITINLRNTNPDIFHYDNVLISKTGFTNAAGRCVLMLVENSKNLYTVVVLGQTNPKTRSQVVGNLLSIEFPKEPAIKIDSRVEFEYSYPL
jgi:D-alanyl-D-alanine endopeptidase (penicillin-binding protein 7)